ncbi:MAG: heparan-alpha-glucosaminide N-acetyltransferase domain-containing protein [Chloroherpetonaceae bacterium]
MNMNVSSNRLPSLDLARILAMLMMIAGHTFFSLVNPDLIDLNSFPWNWWNFLRGVTAPVFLTVSGIVQVFANKREESGKLSPTTVHKRMKTALSLLFIGYLLMFPAQNLYDIPYISKSIVHTFLSVNILQLFGITLLLVLLEFVLTRSSKSLFRISLATGLLIVILTPIVQRINWFQILPYALASYLDPTKGSFFTIFPFSAYVFLGVSIGTILQRVESTKRLDFIMHKSIIAAPILLVLGMLISFLDFNVFNNSGNLYRAGIGIIILRLCCVVTMFYITGVLTKIFKKYESYFIFFGKKSLFVYVIHMFILYGTALTPGINTFFAFQLSIPWALFNILIVLSSTLILSYLINIYSKINKPVEFLYRGSIAFYLVYVLLI